RVRGRIAGQEVPDSRRSVRVPAQCDNPVAVGADRHAVDCALGASQESRGGGRVLGREVPEARRAGITPRDKPAAVRADFDQASASVKDIGLGSGVGRLEIPAPRCIVETRRYNPAAVGADYHAVYDAWVPSEWQPADAAEGIQQRLMTAGEQSCTGLQSCAA